MLADATALTLTGLCLFVFCYVFLAKGRIMALGSDFVCARAHFVLSGQAFKK